MNTARKQDTTPATEPKIELRGVKYAKFASQETACFQGTLYADGQPVAFVSNEGHGGADLWQPAKGKDMDAAMLALARRINPEAQLRFTETKVSGEPWEEIEAALESGDYYRKGDRTAEEICSWLAGRALDEHLGARELKRLLKNGAMVVCRDGQVFRWKLPKNHGPITATDYDKMAARMSAKDNPIVHYLNRVPFEDALVHYLASTK